MRQYFFILGQNPALSLAEIQSRLSLKNIDYRVKAVEPVFLVIETAAVIRPQAWIKQLGGTIKIGRLGPDKSLNLKACLKIVLNPKPFFDIKKKLYFGFSFYGTDKKKRQEFSRQIKKLAIDLKKILKKENIKSRWVVSHEPVLSSVVVKKNRLLEQGAEIVVLSGEKNYLGWTAAVQPFEELSFRDYQKPRRDILEGILPPKLAQIMINLAEVKDGLILDPFCGTGTIISEAILMGYDDLICSDLKKSAVSNARENINWLLEKENLPQLKGQIQYLVSDVKKLNQSFQSKAGRPLAERKEKIEAIISEPYLGPLLKGGEGIKKIQSIAGELSDLYLEAFKIFKKILNKSGRVVIIFPVFQADYQNLFLPVLDKIKELGFKQKPLLSKEFSKLDFIRTTERGTLVYSRPNQRVQREIIKFILD